MARGSLGFACGVGRGTLPIMQSTDFLDDATWVILARSLALSRRESILGPADPSTQITRHALEELATECSVDFDAAGSYYDQALLGEGAGYPTPVAVENFRMLQDRQTSDTSDELAGGGSKAGRVNLLNWDGRGTPTGLFPPPADKQNGDR